MAVAEVTIDEFAEAIAGGARVIDVREPNEYDEAHVPGAVLIPLAGVPDNVDAFRGDDDHRFGLLELVPLSRALFNRWSAVFGHQNACPIEM